MVRNAGEVVGVFGGLEIKQGKSKKKRDYVSNIDFPGLGELEGLVEILKAPSWVDENSNLPELDEYKLAKGKALYAAHCTKCHEVIDSADQYEFYDAILVPVDSIKTDPMTSWAAEHHVASSGMLKGTKAEVLAGTTFGDSTRAISVPINGVVGSLLRDFSGFWKGVRITQRIGNRKVKRSALKQHIMIRDSMVESQAAVHNLAPYVYTDSGRTLNLKGLRYKARPLNGIWATAPFLHNGSVPNLWALLQKPEDRPTHFMVGSQEFDAIRVGVVTDKGKNDFQVKDGNKIIPGNSNLGHEAGTDLTDEEKWALIEYMKSL
jgi:hypothetical protein